MYHDILWIYIEISQLTGYLMKIIRQKEQNMS